MANRNSPRHCRECGPLHPFFQLDSSTNCREKEETAAARHMCRLKHALQNCGCDMCKPTHSLLPVQHESTVACHASALWRKPLLGYTLQSLISYHVYRQTHGPNTYRKTDNTCACTMIVSHKAEHSLKNTELTSTMTETRKTQHLIRTTLPF